MFRVRLRLPHLLNQTVNEDQLFDHQRSEDEGIHVPNSDPPGYAVHREDKGQPHVDHALKLSDSIGIEIDLRRQTLCSLDCGAHRDTKISSHLQGVDNMEIMGPGLGEILPCVHRGISRNILLLPIGWRSILVVALQRSLIVIPIVAKELAEGW